MAKVDETSLRGARRKLGLTVSDPRQRLTPDEMRLAASFVQSAGVRAPAGGSASPAKRRGQRTR